MSSSQNVFPVRLAATFTAEPLVPPFARWASEFGFPAEVGVGPFNQVLQQLLDPGSALATNRDGLNAVLVRACDLGVENPAQARAAAREVGAAVAESATRDGVRTLVMVCPAADGSECERVFQEDLRGQLDGVAGVEVIDVPSAVAPYQVGEIFDEQTSRAASMPYSEEMYAALGTVLFRRLMGRVRKPFKVIAVDCDHTLWTGVCGEAGPCGVEVDASRQAFQRFLMAKCAEGYLLCLVSKNHPEDVEAVFREHSDMVIGRDAFVAAMVNWEPKSANVRKLSERLNLGLDSFVFLDDNPMEVAEMEANAPAVLALQVPEDSAEVPGFVDHLWVLDSRGATDEDAKRAAFYHQDARRQDLREKASSFEEFIEGLELRMDIGPVTEDEVARASQLTQRTNQFNACPQPRDEAALNEACRGMRAQIVKVRDRFGDYGAVGLMFTREDGGRLWAETFLLSCRALGKGVEQRMLRHLGDLAEQLGLGELAIWFNDTGRNQPVKKFLESVEGRWEDGVRIIPAAAARRCPLVPMAAAEVKPVGEVITPQADAAQIARIARELASARAIRDWAAPAAAPRPDLAERYVAPEGETETKVAEIWREVLGLERVGRRDRFVDLGGSSVQLVRVFARMRRAFDARFELVRLFESPTVADQARLVAPRRDGAAVPVAGDSPAAAENAGAADDDDALAIVGMSVRLPGASSPDELWHHLREGTDLITRFDPSEAEVPVPEDDADFVCARGLLDPEVYEGVDGGVFGIVPREAAMIDPQQRVFLELCWEAMERAGYVPDDAEKDGGRVGVYAGCYYDTYLPHHILSDPERYRRHLAEAQVGSLQVEFGNDKDHLATRVAFKLNLKGPSLTVQTACSSSLVAVAHAAMALRSGQCQMALAGGVTVTVPQKRGYRHQQGSMLSKDGRCRPFDADSSGTVFSNGGGAVLLKRLSDAVRDGDHIHAVLRGFGINNDGGQKHSYAAPSVDGQADAIRRAHLDAGVDPRTISYVEAHGTATPLGDPIEVAGLTQAFRQGTDERGFCAIGSLKSNLGHLDTAAGVCGLIKTAMSLERGELPAVMHYQTPNPKIDFGETPFFVNDRLRPWRGGDDAPLRAGVSSFGVGGTNVHVVLEQAPRDVTPSAAPEGERVFLLSGRGDRAIDEFAARLADHADGADPADFAAAARTLMTGRKAMSHRAAVVAADWPSLAAKLRAGEYAAVESGGSPPPLVWMFPGQGAQHPGMTRGLYQSEPGYREDIDFCAAFLRPLLGEDLRETLFASDGGESAERLKRTVLAQPAIFVVEWALARQWERWGLRPESMIGHSVGEFAAACLAGVFSPEDGLRLLAERGRLMDAVERGSMLSVRLPEDDLVARLPDDLDLASVNGPALCVVAGPSARVTAFAADLEGDGVNVRELHTSHAFHSRMMDGMVAEFRKVLERIALHPPQRPIFSTVTNRPLEAAEATDPGYWAAHLRRTVRFHGAVEVVAANAGGRIFLEVGPGQTLTTLARQTAGRRAAGCLPSCEHPASGAPDGTRMRLTLGELWARGVELDPARVFPDVPARRIPLPTYPFQRKRAWLECQLLDRPLPETARPTAPAEAAAPEPETAAAPAETLAAKVARVLEDLSGIPAEEMDPKAKFLELGFDSLLLTQASRQLQKSFGVAISFRDLMQSVPTLGQLVSHLKARGVTVGGEAAPAATAESPVAPAAPVAPVDGDEDGVESGVSGPRTRIDRVSSAEAFTPTQRRHLDALIERYCAKTKTSKEKTRQYRRWHADPRTVNGFNRLWKEMVYQVVAKGMKGSRMWDVDGNEYVDMVNGFGPNFFGHSPDFVTEAIQKQLATGLEIGPQCEAAMETSKLFCEVTGNERVCFLNTGSEAVQAAMRIARTVTGRDKVLVFDKDYHGNFDPVLVRSVGKGARRRTLPLAPGIPDSAVNDVIVVPWGRPEALDMIREVAGELAAVLVEPVQSRQPELIPIDFVREVKQISEENGFLLVFDEVITGIRQGPRGAQELYGVRADLATYGKVFGGGALPIGIVGGKAEYMDTFDGGHWQFGDDSFPEKEVTFFAGTFVRLPLAMAACRAVLEHVKAQPESYWRDIGRRADRLAGTVDRMFRDHGIDVRLVNCHSQMYLRIGDDAKHGNLIYYHLREKGVFAMEGLPFYLTAAHTDADVDFVINAFRETIAELQDGGFFPKVEAVPGIEVPAGARGAFPMTEPMAEIWLGSLLGEEANLAFNEMLQLRLRGAYDTAAIHAAIQDVVDRHDALRMRVPAGRAPVFVIDREQPARILESDFRDAADPESELRRLGREQRETPFDFTAGPLFRVTVAYLANDEVVLQFAAHHIAVDGWSFAVIIDDFAAAYEARKNGRPARFAPAPSIIDRALREARGSDGATADLDWWAGRFADGVPEADLPLRKSYPATPGYRSATCEVKLDHEMSDRLRKLASGCGSTLNSAMLAGFQAWISKLSGQREFVMTFPTAGQMHGGDEALVGHCVNFLPLLADVDETKPFGDLVNAASAGQLDAIEHGSVTYGQLLRTLKIGRDGGRRPLMEVIFNFEPSGDPGDFGGLEARVETVPAHYSNATIFLNVMRLPDGLLLSSTYNCELIDEGTMRAWLESLRVLLDDAVARPEAPLAELRTLDEVGRETMAAWADGGPTDLDGSIDARFRSIAAEHAGRVALSWRGETWSYARLDGMVDAVAAGLTRHGLSSGERVAVMIPRSPEWVASLLGVLRVGACYVPIDPEFPEARRRQILEDADIRIALSDAEIPGVKTLDPADLPPGEVPEIEIDPEAPAYIMFTSGSTGKPKGVVVPHRGIMRLVQPGGYCDFGPDEVFLQLSNPSFDASTLELFGPLLHGGRLALLDPRKASLEGIAAAVGTEGVTVLWATGGLFELLVEEQIDKLRHLKALFTGGEVMSPKHAKRALEKLPGTVIGNGYGPTENTTFTTWHRVTSEDTAGAIPIGRPIPGTTVAVIDGRGEPAPVGVPGELLCGGAGLALGYLNRPELTAERFVETAGGRMYRTGDLCRWNAAGQLEFVGRLDHQVKIRGFRIELGEIESTLAAHPKITQCKAAVRGTGASGKRLCAWYCLAEGETLETSEIHAFLAELLPSFMHPERLVKLSELPLNTSGKVDMGKLPDGDPVVVAETEREPEGETEIALAAIWCELLDLPKIGRDADFFELGGNSLAGLRMFARIQREFDVSLPLSTLLRAKTVRALAAEIGAGRDGGGAPGGKTELAVVQPEGELPAVCGIHGGDGGILFYRKLAERLPTIRPFVAIESPDLGRSDAIEIGRIEDNAARYVEILRGYQSDGPYALVGYSYGGLVAYEMACQLERAGEEVAYLALFDTVNPVAELRAYALPERVSVYWNAHADLPVGPRLRKLAGRFRNGVGTHFRVKSEVRAARRAPVAEGHTELRAVQLREAHEAAMDAYRPQKFGGTLHLFRASEVNDKVEMPADYGWGSLVGRLEIVDSPGEHLTMFEGEHVGALGDRVNGALGKALVPKKPDEVESEPRDNALVK
jgi:amino acid adenylation domain-containing protein/FkbH-like protein